MSRRWVRQTYTGPAIARTLQEFDSAVMEIFASNPRDVPFAIMYHVDVLAGE